VMQLQVELTEVSRRNVLHAPTPSYHDLIMRYLKERYHSNRQPGDVGHRTIDPSDWRLRCQSWAAVSWSWARFEKVHRGGEGADERR